jgi:hypothetical protein
VRRKIGAVLAFIGAFLIVVAVLAQVYAPDALKKTPLDVNETTHLAGIAKLPNEEGRVTEQPVRAFNNTHTDSAKSDDDVVVFSTFSCLVKDIGDPQNCVSSDDPQDRLITAMADNFASDRYTAEAVNDPEYLPADAVPHEGLVNKWPFDSEKKTYQYWDSFLEQTVDAVYDRTTTLAGVEVYVYTATVEETPAEISDGVQGTYSSTTDFYIEPRTGAIQNQVQHQVRLDEDGKTFLDLNLEFTDEQIQDFADDNGGKADQLKLITETVPLVGYAVGIPLLIIGLGLLFLGRHDTKRPQETTPDAGVGITSPEMTSQQSSPEAAPQEPSTETPEQTSQEPPSQQTPPDTPRETQQ